uniref:Uncharacterized protein n=2 Tax=Timema TaxID=61471 RepID=A0A7R8VHI9_TIMDO|nr:unnamed protein product [Timema douglasi]
MVTSLTTLPLMWAKIVIEGKYNNSIQSIDCDEARNEEETVMLEDAKRWLNSGRCEDVTHPKTGATALHVAAAKGYIKVMR